jgi:hypothetical protein
MQIPVSERSLFIDPIPEDNTLHLDDDVDPVSDDDTNGPADSISAHDDADTDSIASFIPRVSGVHCVHHDLTTFYNPDPALHADIEDANFDLMTL